MLGGLGLRRKVQTMKETTIPEPTRTHIEFESIISTGNVRNSNDGEDLIPDIMARGLLTPLAVSHRPGQTPEYRLLRGHRRQNAIERIREHDPEVYDRWFEDGLIEVDLYTDLSKAQEEMLLVDHNTRSLNTKSELHLAANRLFSVGYGAAQVSQHLAGLLDQRWPLNAKQKEELEKIRHSEGESAYWVAHAKMRANSCTRLKEVFDCPRHVIDGLVYFDTNKVPDWSEANGNDIPKLTVTRIRKLRETFQNDRKADRRYTKETGSPGFFNLWREYVAEDAENASTTSPKAMSAKTLIEQADNCKSPTIANVLRLAAGVEIENFSFNDADSLVLPLDLINESIEDEDSDLYDKINARGEKLYAIQLESVKAEIESEIETEAETVSS